MLVITYGNMKMSQTKYFEKFLKMMLLPKNREKNGEQIWKELELHHFEKYGCNRYKSYGSFKKEKTKYYQVYR